MQEATYPSLAEFHCSQLIRAVEQFHGVYPAPIDLSSKCDAWAIASVLKGKIQHLKDAGSR